MKLIMIAAGLVVVLLTACGSDSGSDEKALLSISDVYGSWQLKSLALENNKDQEVALSGKFISRVTRNGTAHTELRGFSMSFAGEDIYSGCDSFSTAKIEIADGEGISSDGVEVALSGTCNELEGFAVKDRESITSEFYKSGDDLVIKRAFTYLDEDGNSVKDKAVSTYELAAEETWDGEGVDEKFHGDWELVEAYAARDCVDEEAGELAVKGSLKLTLDSDSYEGTAKGFAYGANEGCTATEKGSLSQKKLYVDYTQKSASDPCLEEGDDPEGYVVLGEYDVVATGDRFFSLISQQETNEECTEDLDASIVVAVFEPQ